MSGIACFVIERCQVNGHSGWWRRVDGAGEPFHNSQIPVGALWRATWYEEFPYLCGHDGQAWICQLPGGHSWHIDSRASNCDRPDDWTHRCWCRHGDAPCFTVDKVGVTCTAGVGSIIAPNGWHGFLRNGELAP